LALVSMLFAVLCLGSIASAQTPPFTDFKSYVAWVQKQHKAPFMRDSSLGGKPLAKTTSKTDARKQVAAAGAAEVAPDVTTEAVVATTTNQSVQVNQDRNPWQKVGIAAAVDPKNPKHVVVLSNDFRDGFERIFYHVSTNGGKKWTDDYLTDGGDASLGGAPYSFQRNAKVSFDNNGNTFMTHLSGNNIINANGNCFIFFANLDTQIDLIQGFKNGAYLAQKVIPITTAACGGTELTEVTCGAVLDMPGVTTDSNENSPNDGTTYVYYTLFCNLPADGVCGMGPGGIPGQSSAIFEWDDGAGSGDPFMPEPRLVSGNLMNAQFSDMVIDSHGTPHIIFEDFTKFPTTGLISMWESTLTNGEWVVSASPFELFTWAGQQNPNWNFDTRGGLAPGCVIHGDIAYCAFAANTIDGGVGDATPTKTFLANVNTITGVGGGGLISQQGGDHLFPWAAVSPAGNVSVGWYDDRNDPSGQQLQYFVSTATDGGLGFGPDQPLTSLFNPCAGVPDCGYFGDYDQLAEGPDGVLHATWAETRDGVSMQIYSEAIQP
jgi:hypothetical protein